MDVERGRTVKSWKPRRLGERMYIIIQLIVFIMKGWYSNSFCVYCKHCFSASKFTLFRHGPFLKLFLFFHVRFSGDG